MAAADAVTALRRFGLGPKPGDVARVAADPRGYVRAALEKRDAARLEGADLQPSHVVFTEQRLAQLEQKAARAVAAEAAARTATDAAAGTMRGAGASASAAPAATDMNQAARSSPQAASGTVKPGAIRREAFQEEAAARLARALDTDTPFIERLVMFWSGHFCVSAGKGPVRGLAGAYEREAIRPHVLGRFADMLAAVEQHPAMLIYLDNAQSTGPNSKAGQRNAKGLNENLARETLELHTLGVDGGYSQADVTSLARLITGWTVGGVNQSRAEPGRFFFAAARHEPGPITVLGKRYDGGDRRAGEACLADLARHPATARHIALKLARHFVSDDPPPVLVQRLQTSFRDTDGDLGALARVLVDTPEAWSAPARKITPPYDYIVALGRGLALDPPLPEVLRVSAALGQPLWQPSSPAGWPDGDEAWTAPSSIRERLRLAERAARMTDRMADPRAVAADLLGPALSEATRTAIARAETREQGFEILAMAPEFLRR